MALPIDKAAGDTSPPFVLTFSQIRQIIEELQAKENQLNETLKDLKNQLADCGEKYLQNRQQRLQLLKSKSLAEHQKADQMAIEEGHLMRLMGALGEQIAKLTKEREDARWRIKAVKREMET